MKRFEPTFDRILIKPIPPENFRAGLELEGADVVQKSEGVVVAVGDGVPLHNIQLNITGDTSKESLEALERIIDKIEKGKALIYKPGDYVLYGKYAGTKLALDGEEHIMVRQSDVFGRIID